MRAALIRPLVQITADAQPNPAHQAMAELEKLGFLSAVVTQNIDSLHTKAGSKTVYEVHGHSRQVECLACGREDEAQPHMLKLFDNCKELIMSKSKQVTGMESDEGEKYSFKEIVKPDYMLLPHFH